jgi:hypothetical protein
LSCTRVSQHADAGIEFAGELVRIAAREHHGVPACRQRDQVRLQRQCLADLPVQDLLQQKL